MNDTVTLAVDTLAVYRLTRLAVDDTIADRPRRWTLDRLDNAGPAGAKLAEGLGCYWCLGWWIAAAVAPARRTAAWRAVRWPLAVSAAVGIIAERT